MTKKETRIAAIVLAMVVASFALLLHGMQLENRADRLGAMRSVALPSGEHLAVFHANHLHLLDGQGRRVAHQPLKELLLTEEPNDMDWTVDGAGTAHAWFFEDTTPRLVRCTLAPGEPRLAGCAQVLSGPSLKVDSASRAVHFAVDGARQRVFIADAKGHKVRVLGLDGRVRADSASGLLFFPNRLRLAPGGGQLIVADNDHRRLVWLDIGSDTPSLAQTRILPLSPHPQASGGRTRAADFAFLGGPGDVLSTLWVLGVAQGQKNGDVLLWGPGLAPLGRADLGGWRDPLVIDTLGGAAVVADFDGIVLYRLGRQGEFLGNFGQGPFAAELEAARQGARAGALWVKLGWASFALTLVVGFLLAWRLRERPGAREVREAFADIARERADIPQRTVRLAPARWYAREAAWAAAAGGLVVLALLAVLWLLLPHE
ncbi:MAG TPA: hypothetical protein VLJ58_02325, partial [Ramlibacter sp.]|nr:hypothetical protein [Ramlibacter sp.]